MQSSKRIQKLQEATKLLKGEQPDRPPRIWVLINGVPQDKTFETEKKHNDIVIDRIINVIEREPQ
jgi:hypothetical protein